MNELWRQAAAAARRSLDAGAEGYGAPMELAAINAVQGHTGEALEWIERGYRAGWKDARLLNLDPFFASVRREPRYLALTTGMTQDVAEMRKRATAHRYRLERDLGQGGMATVYLAGDSKHHRKVALKVLRPELSLLREP